MNCQLVKFVNYLLDSDPSPFCEYIINKELLMLDDETVRGSYDWAVRFKLYSELRDEQLPDGSWGGFDDMIVKLSADKHFKATARAIKRILDLSLDQSDPMVSQTIDLCRKYLSGEKDFPNIWGKNNWGKPIETRHSVAKSLSNFVPDDTIVVKLCDFYAEKLETVCRSGFFDESIWNTTDGINPIFSYDKIYMLSSGNYISKETQKIWLEYEWNQKLWYNGNLPSEIKTPDNPSFIFWLARLDNLKNFTLFGDFMAQNNTPYFYELCERLSDKNEDVPIKTNNYFYHQGQYSEAPRNKQHKKNDLLLQIIRILNKCE